MSKKKTKSKRGRPAKYDPDFARQAELLISESGFSLVKLAKLFKVKDRQTIYDWMKAHPEFSCAIESGRDTWNNAKIKRALAQRAAGYKYTETTKERVVEKDDGGNSVEKLVVTKKVRKSVAPDVSAIKHWQVNRDSENWHDSRNIDITPKGNFGVKWIIEKEDEDERRDDKGRIQD